MFANNISPVHFWKGDDDAIEIKLGDLLDLKLAEYVLQPDDCSIELDILSLSPIKNAAVLNLMHRFKKGRGVPGSAASTRRKIQSLKIAKALDDLTCIAETPTRLSICRQGSICNFTAISPLSPARNPGSPVPVRPDAELKYLFEVLGASTPFLHSPPPAVSGQKKSNHCVQMCTMDDIDFYSLNAKSETIAYKAAKSVGFTPLRPKTGIPTPSRSTGKRSISAPPRRSPANDSASCVARSHAAKPVTPQTSRARSQSPVLPNEIKRIISPRHVKTPASPRSAFKKKTDITSPIRTAKVSATRAPRLERAALCDGVDSDLPSYLRPTQNSVASRSASPVRDRNCASKSPRSPLMAKVADIPMRATADKRVSSVANAAVPAATPEKRLMDHLADENISPNVTSRSRQGSGKEMSPPLFNPSTPKAMRSVNKLQGASITKLMAERETENDFFNSVMASCDDILAQLDAAVSKGPKTLVRP